MKISVGQFDPSGDVFENLETMDRLAGSAKADGADLVLFPEESMLAIRKAADLSAAVTRDWSRFVQRLSFIAAGHGIAVVAGGYEPNGEENPFNTVVAVDAKGTIVTTYRKIHLYDAFSFKESERITAGAPEQRAVFELGGLKFGVMTCYDIRFPELARDLALEGADVLLVGAAWYKGEHKVDHWRTLVKARAVENTVWVAAAGTSGAATIGYSGVIDPMAQPVDYLADEAEGLVTVEVTRKRVDEVREFLPVLANRRIGVPAPGDA
ncbi:carbon-nitrogen hydrolase family protein [Galactobacter sp.]|uniref:carbon-nitrogen hydrolase family protein n=1 Tax=Galactobacter sp. TaxID=2676125 RepID=UPI0025BD62E4|nr:carbon-nitrogen hydrolase family protein [Galactobacter sp.]